MSKDALIAVVGGVISALLLLLSIHLGSLVAFVLAYFAPLPLFLVGLGLGLAVLVLAAAAAVVLTSVAAGFDAATLFALVYAVPAVLVVRLALLSRQPPGGATNWYPPGLVACWLTGYGAAAFVVLAIMTGGIQGGLEGIVRGNIAAALERFMADGGGPQLTTMAEAVAAYFPAHVIASWLIMVAVNATLAQRLLTRLGRNLRPAPRLAAFEVPGWMAIPVVIAVLLWLMGGAGTPGFIGRNLTWVFVVPYFLMGLAVVHALSRRWSARSLMLVVFYLVLVLFVWAAFLVAALGFIEQWTGLRRRFAGPGNSQEEAQ